MSEHAQVTALFPTLVYSTQLVGAEQFNQDFLNLMGKYGFETDAHTVQGEYVGKCDMQIEPALKPFMDKVVDHIKAYLSLYALKTDYFDYYVTKTSYAILDKPESSIGPHFHPASDVSFVYYVEAPEGTDPLCIMNDSANSTLDGLVSSFRPLDKSLISEINQFNCQYSSIQPKSGMLVLFLGSTKHMVSHDSSKPFAGRRLSIAGDVNLVLKPEHTAYEYGKQSLSKWKKFEGA
jgi:hypothetical protein